MGRCILITGGTGFIGSALIKELACPENDILVFIHKKKSCEHRIKSISSLNEIQSQTRIDAIINLAGAPIGKRWTKSYKRELFESRIHVTENILKLIDRLKHRPQLLINASAVGYYGLQGEKMLDERSNSTDAFTHRLCRAWESAASGARERGVRLCIARLGIVLGKSGGILKQMTLPFRWGLGGKLGRGDQYLSWIHIDDLIGAFQFFMERNDQEGIYNLTAPNPVTNLAFTTCLGKQLGRSTFLSIPSFFIKILLGQMGDALLLKGNRVLPQRLCHAGFSFRYPKLPRALQNIYEEDPTDSME